MAIRISVDAPNDTEDELRSLYDWLSAEEGLHGLSIQWEPIELAPGQMGALSEALVVLFGAGGAGVALAQSISVWLQTRATDLKLKITTSKGTVEVDSKRLRDPDSLLATISAVVDED